MTNYLFSPDVTVTERLPVRVDTASGSVSPAVITPAGNGNPIGGAVLEPDVLGRLPRFVGTTPTLYLKGSGLAGSPVQITGAPATSARDIGADSSALVPFANSRVVGDASTGIIDWTHNGDFGYLIHFHTGPAYAGVLPVTAALIGLGIGDGNGAGVLNDGGIGLLISNKKSGEGIRIENKSTIDNAIAYGVHGIQNSTLAPLVFLEQTIASAKELLSLTAQGAPAAGQVLVRFSSTTGGSASFGNNIGRIYADTGVMDWYKDIRADGARLIALGADNVTANQHQTHVEAGYLRNYRYTGGSSWYPWRVGAQGGGGGIEWALETGATTATLGGETYNTSIIRAARVSNAAAIGFLGVAPIVRKAGWTAATGSATRTTFDTTTVTLPQLAEHVKALIDDLGATAGFGLLSA
jgi:hypothetical protein